MNTKKSVKSNKESKNGKLKIGVLFGGKSAEHEVSLVSAKNVINALDKNKYKVTSVKIGKDGKFNINILKKFDLIFPVLHGPFGEDGSMQGLFKILDIPFVGAGVLGSAVGMDKDVMKRLLREAKIPVGDFLILENGEEKKYCFEQIEKKLGMPVYVKPANMGSSVGVSKVQNDAELKKAIKEAFKYDTKIVIEEELKGREIECSVLGNENPKASLPGEIIPVNDFYSYKAKYISKNSALLKVPAELSKKEIKMVQEMAVKAFKVLNCRGLGRLDFFLLKNGKLYINEINTLPGFTSISMYPKLWEASGLPIGKLLDNIIDLALERFNKEKKLKTTLK